ncbi:RNA-dependent RNA polymerase [viral metagenome]|uniref:RNA-dependent RNA polymerase n=1 Tax=viral metagenome TaxID=1070528 RepID=A0A6L2ZK74_9ZZZZ
MAKRSTPAFLAEIKAKIDGAKSASRTQAQKRKDAQKTETRLQRRKSKSDLKEEARNQSISIPDYVKVMAFDSLEWKAATECDVSFGARKDKNGNDINESLSSLLKHARGIEKNHTRAKQSEREKWARDISPQMLRDALFNSIPEGPIKDFERKFYIKWGDYRSLAWANWCETLWDYYKPREFKPDADVWAVVKDFVTWELLTSRGRFEEDFVEPIRDDAKAFETVTVDKNSGMPFAIRKWAENEHIVDYYTKMAGAMIDGEFPHEWFMNTYNVDETTARLSTASLMFTRRQTNGGLDENLSPTRPDGKASVKMRAVQAPPKADAIAGKHFIDPFLDRMKEIESYAGLAGADNIGVFMHEQLLNYEFSFEGDFSAFDQSCQRALMNEVIDVIKACFDPIFSRYFEMIREWYPTMWAITPSGVTTGEHGLFSGCAWTSVIGTLANRLTTLYTLFRMGIDASDQNNIEHLCFGDDIALFSNQKINIEEFEAYQQECGMDCNKSKQEQSEGPERFITFLGYRHYANIHPELDKDYIGIFPIMRTQLCFLERYTDDLSAVTSAMGITARTFDIMRYTCKLENLRNHPNRMNALDVFLKFGMPLEHILYSGEVPSELRVGRRSRGVLFSEHWLMSEEVYKLAESYPNGTNRNKLDPTTGDLLRLETALANS